MPVEQQEGIKPGSNADDDTPPKRTASISLMKKIIGIGAWTLLVLFILCGLWGAYYFVITRNPLPGDEEMITHFQAHQADFEEVVRRYRAFDAGTDGSPGGWAAQEGTPALLKRAGLRKHIFYSTPAWWPDPYSLTTAVALEKARGKGSMKISRAYGAVVLRPSPKKRFRAMNLRYVTVWKDFMFFPEVPRIENGELLWPINTRGNYAKRRRVLPSLNDFPGEWKDYECVLRKIEPQWFIRMCNGH